MNILSVENIYKSYTEKQLLNNISLGINEGNKIGLIGVNGTGKSTLLKIITGIEKPDKGRIIKNNNTRIEYLSQNPHFDREATVLEQVFKGNSDIMKLVREYQMAINNPDISNEKIIKLTNKMDTMNAWDLESEAKAILTKLGIPDFNAKVGNMSGGEKKRIALASALINPSDLLILDEPTNHLDNDTIDWLEEYLNNKKGSLIMITHDRYFLDRIVNHIIELDRGNLYTYVGNYNSYLEKKLEREEVELAKEKKRQRLFKKELAWMKKGVKARTTKQKARIDRFEKLEESNVNIKEDKMDISVGSSRLGRKVVEIENISKSFDNKVVIDDFSYIVLRDDRVGIIGPNGSGKSTLINIISGKLNPNKGDVTIGETVKMGVFSQEAHEMDNNLRVIEYIKKGAEYITTSKGDKITASQMLERFLFPPDIQWNLIGKLSGGEKRRLHLLRVLMEAPNVLILDEPTNDLDINTLTILEDYLEEFEGAVISVSHDRYFLDKMAEKIFVFEGKGKIVQYTGNYTQIKKDAKLTNSKAINEKKETKNKSENKKEKIKPKDKSLKFSYNEKREFEEIDDIIVNLEAKVEEIESKIEGASTDYVRLQELISEKKEIEEKLDEKMKRWVYLNELAEKIEDKK
ncbi:ABC-F family ATP-binding cassette domain-containing protein [Dethiothermospora halolimnae]|uniref:ABC-F family ATP-binding cassette domain-containing protein n=1 Tax=Dethiothermospora halolimnae TaxID=3114390 RepID=UPI003CCBAAE2